MIDTNMIVAIIFIVFVMLAICIIPLMSFNDSGDGEFFNQAQSGMGEWKLEKTGSWHERKTVEGRFIGCTTTSILKRGLFRDKWVISTPCIVCGKKSDIGKFVRWADND